MCLIGFDNEDLFLLQQNTGTLEKISVFAGASVGADNVDFIPGAQHNPLTYIRLVKCFFVDFTTPTAMGGAANHVPAIVNGLDLSRYL